MSHLRRCGSQQLKASSRHSTTCSCLIRQRIRLIRQLMSCLRSRTVHATSRGFRGTCWRAALYVSSAASSGGWYSLLKSACASMPTARQRTFAIAFESQSSGSGAQGLHGVLRLVGPVPSGVVGVLVAGVGIAVHVGSFEWTCPASTRLCHATVAETVPPRARRRSGDDEPSTMDGMAKSGALAAAGLSIRDLLVRRIAEQVPDPPGPRPEVVLAGTNDFDDVGRSPGAIINFPAISLYCYRLTVDRETRPGWSAVSSVDGVPRLPLRMHFLLSAWDTTVVTEFEVPGTRGADP